MIYFKPRFRKEKMFVLEKKRNSPKNTADST